MSRLLQVLLAFSFIFSTFMLPSNVLPQPLTPEPATAQTPADCGEGSSRLECVLTIEDGYVSPGGNHYGSSVSSNGCTGGTLTFMNSASSVAEERRDFVNEAIARARRIFEPADGLFGALVGAESPTYVYWRLAKYDHAAVGTGVRSPSATAPYIGPQSDASWFAGKRRAFGAYHRDAGQLNMDAYSINNFPSYWTTTGRTYWFYMEENPDGTYRVPSPQEAVNQLGAIRRNTLARYFMPGTGLAIFQKYPLLMSYYKDEFASPSNMITIGSSGSEIVIPPNQWGNRDFARTELASWQRPVWGIRVYYDGHDATFTSYEQLRQTVDRVVDAQIALLLEPYSPARKFAYLPAFFNSRSGDYCEYLTVNTGARFGPNSSRRGACPTWNLDQIGEYPGPILDPSGCYLAWHRLEKIPPKVSSSASRYVVDNMTKPVAFQGPGNASSGFTIGVAGPIYPLATTAAQRVPGGRTQIVGDPLIPQLSINVRQLGVVAYLGNQVWSDVQRWDLNTAQPTQSQYESMYKLTLKPFTQTPLSVAQDTAHPLNSQVFWCLAPRATDSGQTLRNLLDGCQTNTATYPGRQFEARYRLTIRTYWTAAYRSSVFPANMWRPFFNCATAHISGCPTPATMETWNTSGNRSRWGTSVPSFGSPIKPRNYAPTWPQQFLPDDRNVGIWYEQSYLYVRVQQIQSR